MPAQLAIEPEQPRLRLPASGCQRPLPPLLGRMSPARRPVDVVIREGGAETFRYLHLPDAALQERAGGADECLPIPRLAPCKLDAFGDGPRASSTSTDQTRCGECFDSRSSTGP